MPSGRGSSEETVTLGADNFFLTFLDALRNICLFAVCAAPLAFADVSEGSERTFSEKVRLMPASGAGSCAPGMYVKLAERDRPLFASSSSILAGGNAAFESTGL